MRKPPVFQDANDLEAAYVLVARDLLKNHRRRLPDARVCFVVVDKDIKNFSPRLVYGLKKAVTSLGFAARDATDSYTVGGLLHSRTLKVRGFSLGFYDKAVRTGETVVVSFSTAWGSRQGLAWEYALKKQDSDWRIVKSEITAQF